LKEIEGAIDIPVVARIPDDKKNIKALFMRIPPSIFNRRSKFGREVNRLSSALTGNKEKRNIFRRLLPVNMRKEEVNRQILRKDFYNPVFK